VSKDRIRAAVLEQVRAAAGEAGPAVAIDLRLGATGFVADLAILDDELIGVVIVDSSDDLDDLPGRLEATSHYFERVVLVVALGQLPSLDRTLLSGATVWTHDGDGQLVEHDPGEGNRVALNACFDLLRMDERRYVLGELVVEDAAQPRGAFTVPAPRTRALFGMVFTARHGQTSTGFWAAVADRPITPADLISLVGTGERRDAAGRERRRSAA